MLLHILRVIVGGMIIAIGISYTDAITSESNSPIPPAVPILIYIFSIALAVAVVAIEWLIPRKSLAAIAGLFFGLVVGMLITYGLTLITDLFAKLYGLHDEQTMTTVNVLMGVIVCFFCVSFILQTKDDIRFVI